MTLRILVLGAGGREHALAWRLAADPGTDVLVAPGNARIAAEHRCVAVDERDPAAVAELAAREGVQLVVVGPEAPLAAGVTGVLAARGIAVFGPSSAAARLEWSKTFAKEVLGAAEVPTAAARSCVTRAEVAAALDGFGPPYVVKADGLAAGKGVLVTRERAAALEFAARCLEAGLLGDSGRRVLVEQFLDGEEASVMAVCDGERFVLLPAARDYKRAHDGDLGPNTGGMGAFAPLEAIDAGLESEIGRRIVTPVLRAMAARGTPYRGTLYCGLMLTPDGPQVVEFNSRFGDPEAQVILPLVSGPFGELLLGAARGTLDPASVGRETGAAVAVALVDEGYPERVAGNGSIEGLDAMAAQEHVRVFGAGLERSAGGWAVRGGRAAYVMACGETRAEARRRAYRAIDSLGGRGWRCRRDVAADMKQAAAGAASRPARAGHA